MPHSHQSKLGRRMSPQLVKKEIRRRQTKIKFMPVTDDLFLNSPHFFETPEFIKIHKHPKVKDFIRSFWSWNEYALPVMSKSAHPNIDMQQELVRLASPYIGETIFDLGCGAGDFYNQLFANGLKSVQRIFALDLDWEALALVPHKLKNLNYRGKLALIQSSTMSAFPVWDEQVDTVISSIGGVTYAGWWFNENGQLICEGREALLHCLKECHRVLKPGGYLAFSTLINRPNFEKVLADSLWWPLSHFKFSTFIDILLHGFHIKKISQFLKKAESEGHAHYLPLAEWVDILDIAGFEIVEHNYGKCYASQGAVFIARKK